ncbi:MAG: hypothetical protein GX375_02345 [Clostridiales bacterium]|nr:hypothetical protein [Clostridiales bacterium]
MNYRSIIAVTNTGDSSISIIDPLRFKEMRRIRLIPDSGPYDLIKCKSSHHLLVSQYYDDSVAYIDLLSGEIIDSIAIGRRPWYMSHDWARNLAFITNSDSDTISIVCTDELKLIGQVRVGSMPQGIHFDPVVGDLAIANVNSNSVMVIDTYTYIVKKSIKLEQNPFQVVYSADGNRLYVSSSSFQNNDIGSILTIATHDYRILSEIKLNAMPGQLYITKDGKYILVASLGKGGLEIVDINNGKTLQRVSTNGMTHGMAMDNQEKYVYVTNPDDDSISVIDWRLGKKIATIGVGKEPNGIALI